MEIELTGGYFDGRRATVDGDAAEYAFPVPPQVTLGPDPDVTRTAPDILLYRRAGIRDDGTRVYQVV